MILGKSFLWALLFIPCLLAQSSNNTTNDDNNNITNSTSNSTNSDLDDENNSDNNSYDLNITNGTNSTNITFPQSIILDMSSREVRYHHYLWHQVRDGWLRFTPEVQARYTEIGWAAPRPSRSYDENGVATMLYDNDSGEDFLYMHRQMIIRANNVSAQNNESFGNVTGWKTIPAPGDEEYPVPPEYNITDDESTTASTTRRKTDDFYYNNIKPQEDYFKNPDNLRKLTLGQLGSRIEITVHGWIHMRFSSNCTYGYRPGYTRRNNLPYIDEKWDDPEYNWLGDSYASQVHPYFWKIHGWVDDRIEDWKAANNVTEIEWKGTWVGGPMMNISMLTGVNISSFSFKTQQGLRGSTMPAMENMEMGSESGMNVLEEAFKIFADSGIPESSFADVITEFEKL